MADDGKIGLFGETIGEDSLKQLKLREKIKAKNSKSIEEVQYLSSNCPWIILRSGVDIPSDSQQNKPKINGGNVEEPAVTNALAKQYVLAGGQFYANADNSYGQRAGLGSAYTSGRLGFRPMPGITGANIKTKDTWGAIMEGTVNFTVSSMEDLAAIDKLYFKPGMVVLLEWGHSIYPDNSTESIKFVNDPATAIVPNKMFFEEAHTLDEINEEVIKRRVSSNGNYEGMVGYITNYSYSFKNNVWECSLTVVSKGTLLNSLQISKSDRTNEGDDPETKKAESKSKFHEILVPVLAKSKSVNSNIWNKGEEFNIKNLDITGYRVRTTCKIGVLGVWSWYLPYIKLSDFFKIVNHIIDKEDRKGDTKYTFDPQYFPENHLYKYVTFREHISLNPSIAVRSRAGAIGISTGIPVSEKNLKTSFSIPNLIPDTNLTKEDDETRYDVIGDIYIGVPYILDCVEKIIDSSTGTYSMSKLIELILTGTQKALGNVNNFGEHSFKLTDGTEFKTIIDRNNTNAPFGTQNTEIGTITVSGLGSTVRNLEINSNISPEVVNEMAIAAAAPDKNLSKEANPTVVFWNEGCRNRHRVGEETRTTSPSSTNNTEEEIEKYITNLRIWYKPSPLCRFYTQLQDLYDTIIKGNVRSDGAESASNTISDMANAHLTLSGESIYKRVLLQEALSGETDGYLQMGIMPISVEFTLDGLSRFVVGTVFKIKSDLIPDKYKDWGYIVTGVENSISNSGWTTKIKSQYYPIVKMKKANKDIGDQESASYVDATWNYTIYRAPGTVSTKFFDEDPAKYMDITKNHKVPGKHLRARYAYNYARFLVTPYSKWTKAMVDTPVGANANDSAFDTKVLSLGYAINGTKQKCTANDIQTAIRTLKPGDGIRYWQPEGQHMHVCFRRVGLPEYMKYPVQPTAPGLYHPECSFISDFLQFNGFVY